MTLTVLTWLWSQPGGRTSYTAGHVNIWADMVARNLSTPHRLACVTDMPDGIDAGVEIIAPPREFEDVRIPSWGDARPQCLRRLVMFRPDAAEIFGERFVCMDLDCVIGGQLDPFFETEAGFKICAGTAKGRPYNGSMMILRAGARPQVYTEFTGAKAVEAGRKFVGSDQAWISAILGPNEEVWRQEDGIAWFGQYRPPSSVLTFFPGHLKPWDTASGWIGQHYRRSPRFGRCLILGYDENLWGDVESALNEGPFEAVIASPEAAEHWPGPILAVARTNEEAVRLAGIHGYSDIRRCGMKEAA